MKSLINLKTKRELLFSRINANKTNNINKEELLLQLSDIRQLMQLRRELDNLNHKNDMRRTKRAI